MSTIVFSDQSSVFFYTLQWTDIKFRRTSDKQITARPCIGEKMPKTKITSHAKHPDCTQQFLNAIQNALDMFEDKISSLTEEIRGKAYRNYVIAYHEALIPVWNLAHFASIGTVMETIADTNLKEITNMAKRL